VPRSTAAIESSRIANASSISVAETVRGGARRSVLPSRIPGRSPPTISPRSIHATATAAARVGYSAAGSDHQQSKSHQPDLGHPMERLGCPVQLWGRIGPDRVFDRPVLPHPRPVARHAPRHMQRARCSCLHAAPHSATPPTRRPARSLATLAPHISRCKDDLLNAKHPKYLPTHRLSHEPMPFANPTIVRRTFAETSRRRPPEGRVGKRQGRRATLRSESTSDRKVSTASASRSKNRSQKPDSSQSLGPSSTTPSWDTVQAQDFGTGWATAENKLESANIGARPSSESARNLMLRPGRAKTANRSYSR
jgi:hypothetical protein